MTAKNSWIFKDKVQILMALRISAISFGMMFLQACQFPIVQKKEMEYILIYEINGMRSNYDVKFQCRYQNRGYFSASGYEWVLWSATPVYLPTTIKAGNNDDIKMEPHVEKKSSGTLMETICLNDIKNLYLSISNGDKKLTIPFDEIAGKRVDINSHSIYIVSARMTVIKSGHAIYGRP